LGGRGAYSGKTRENLGLENYSSEEKKSRILPSGRGEPKIKAGPIGRKLGLFSPKRKKRGPENLNPPKKGRKVAGAF